MPQRGRDLLGLDNSHDLRNIVFWLEGRRWRPELAHSFGRLKHKVVLPALPDGLTAPVISHACAPASLAFS